MPAAAAGGVTETALGATALGVVPRSGPGAQAAENQATNQANRIRNDDLESLIAPSAFLFISDSLAGLPGLSLWGAKCYLASVTMESADSAELAARYVLELAALHGGAKQFQGARRPELGCRATGSAIRRFATERVYRVPTLAARALVEWAEGAPVELLTHVPEARHVLDLQARGARCVSVLPEGAPTHPHAGRFEFVLHDLCHLGKFVCSEHYPEQVGFFATLRNAFDDPAWRELESELDGEFERDRDHVSTDMNGSSVFLFAVFKMKLKMAARRLFARRRGVAPVEEGALSAGEFEVFRDLLDRALGALGFEGQLRTAALQTSARRDVPEMAALLADHFRNMGLGILSRGAR